MARTLPPSRQGLGAQHRTLHRMDPRRKPPPHDPEARKILLFHVSFGFRHCSHCPFQNRVVAQRALSAICQLLDAYAKRVMHPPPSSRLPKREAIRSRASPGMASFLETPCDRRPPMVPVRAVPPRRMPGAMGSFQEIPSGTCAIPDLRAPDGERPDPGPDLAFRTAPLPHDPLTAIGEPVAGEPVEDRPDLGLERAREHPARAVPRDPGERVVAGRRLAQPDDAGIFRHGASRRLEVLAGLIPRHDTPPSKPASPNSGHGSPACDHHRTRCVLFKQREPGRLMKPQTASIWLRSRQVGCKRAREGRSARGPDSTQTVPALT